MSDYRPAPHDDRDDSAQSGEPFASLPRKLSTSGDRADWLDRPSRVGCDFGPRASEAWHRTRARSPGLLVAAIANARRGRVEADVVRLEDPRPIDTERRRMGPDVVAVARPVVARGATAGGSVHPLSIHV